MTTHPLQAQIDAAKAANEALEVAAFQRLRHYAASAGITAVRTFHDDGAEFLSKVQINGVWSAYDLYDDPNDLQQFVDYLHVVEPMEDGDDCEIEF